MGHYEKTRGPIASVPYDNCRVENKGKRNNLNIPMRQKFREEKDLDYQKGRSADNSPVKGTVEFWGVRLCPEEAPGEYQRPKDDRIQSKAYGIVVPFRPARPQILKAYAV